MSDSPTVYDVFTPTTQARVNFVPRVGIGESLASTLRTPGMQVVVYGETGSGKSTLLQKKLEELYEAHVTTRCTVDMTFDEIVLNAFDQLGSFYMDAASRSASSGVKTSLSAEFMGIKSAVETARQQNAGGSWRRVIPPRLTVQRLGELMGGARRCWVIEDFHKVADSEKTRLSQALKVFSDLASEFREVRVVAVGATETARQVVQYDREMRNRVAEILVPLMTDEELADIVSSGARLLNVDFHDLVDRIVTYSMGVAAVTHELALNACLHEEVFERQSHTHTIPSRALDASIERWVLDSSDSVKARFDSALRRPRVRGYDNMRLILGALADGDLEGMLPGGILDAIRRSEPGYSATSIRRYLRELETDSRGSLLMITADGRYRFVDPLLQTYAKLIFRGSTVSKGTPAVESAVIVDLMEELKRTMELWKSKREGPPSTG